MPWKMPLELQLRTHTLQQLKAELIHQQQHPQQLKQQVQL
jgi:hypothetical protein